MKPESEEIIPTAELAQDDSTPPCGYELDFLLTTYGKKTNPTLDNESENAVYSYNQQWV